MERGKIFSWLLIRQILPHPSSFLVCSEAGNYQIVSVRRVAIEYPDEFISVDKQDELPRTSTLHVCGSCFISFAAEKAILSSFINR